MIREHEDDVEADFARFYPNVDYRDRYRPGGGASQLTLRRLLVLVSKLPPESAFSSATEGRVPVSEVSAAVGDVVHALTGKPWPRWTQLERQREAAARQELLAEKRAQARAFKHGHQRERR